MENKGIRELMFAGFIISVILSIITVFLSIDNGIKSLELSKLIGFLIMINIANLVFVINVNNNLREKNAN